MSSVSFRATSYVEKDKQTNKKILLANTESVPLTDIHTIKKGLMQKPFFSSFPAHWLFIRSTNEELTYLVMLTVVLNCDWLND